MGHILKCFYELHDNKEYNNSLLYSFGFNGYIDNISGLSRNISNKNMNKARFTKKGTSSFKKSFYPNLINKTSVKNSYDLNKNMLITGPNASGKTTLLKTTLINIILSQQLGFGCYAAAKIIPFKFIHCYLNIPDTSARDSLFQAEARRCKEIIDCIHENSNERHFCVFDELYSGTNPEEASISAQAFMEYISKYKKVSCILTTHYIDLCKHLSNNNRIQNYNMKTIKIDQTFEYTYQLIEGISEIKGGLKVLYDMNYPSEILNKTIQ
jgi:DNA mismatch repair ATPase MutS